MSVMAVGPALDIDGPLPEAPEHSLLLTPGVLRGRDATRVLNGVNVDGYPTGCPSLWEPCSDGTFRIKEEETGTIPGDRFDPFVVYQPVMCSGIGLGNGNARKLSDRIETVLDATVSSGVEQAIAGGIDAGTNPFIGDGDVSKPLGNTAVSPQVALGTLENEIARTCRKGMILATPATITSYGAFPLDPDRPLVTAAGTPVVSASGVVDLDTPQLPETSGTQDWMLASGPIHVYLGPIEARDIEESLDRSDNTVVFRAERWVVAFWDKAFQAAVKVDWSL
jgi:hypothetical protein